MLLASSSALSLCGVVGADFSLIGVVGADFSDTILSNIVGGSSSGISSMVLCLVILPPAPTPRPAPIDSLRRAFITDDSIKKSCFVSLVRTVSLLFGRVSFVMVDLALSGRPDFLFDFDVERRE